MAAQSGRREFWQAHVDAWRESGLTQRAYCREHELPEEQLSHWKHRLRKAQRRARTRSRLVPIRVLQESTPRTANLDEHTSQARHCGGDLTLVLGNGLRLEIGDDFNSATLCRVLEVLAHVG